MLIGLPVTYLLFLSIELDFSLQILENYSYTRNFVIIRLVGVEMFHADGKTDRHDETNLSN
jgi:hypothetical protein